MLLLAVIARMAAGRRIVVGLFVLLLLVAVAAQVWLGSLLLFDTPSGSVWNFNSTAAPSTQPTQADEEPTTAPATTTTTTTTISANAPAEVPG
jgi:hypothetical protein